MKNIFGTIRISAIFIISLLLSFYSFATDDHDREQLIVPLPEIFGKGLLILNHHKGAIAITGYNGHSIIVKATLRFKKTPAALEGMQQIVVHEIQLGAEIEKNVVTIRTGPPEKTIDLEIQVPANFSLRIKNYDNGNVLAQNLEGEMEISNINGDITIINIKGSAVLNTIDGDISVDLQEVTPNQPMAFTSMEGKIELNLPRDTRANLKLRTDHGKIYSDFEINLQLRNTNVETDKKGRINRISLNEWTLGAINGGGPDYLVKSYNGNIFIRSGN